MGRNPFPFPVSVVLDIFIILWKAELDRIKKVEASQEQFNCLTDKMKKSNYYF